MTTIYKCFDELIDLEYPLRLTRYGLKGINFALESLPAGALVPEDFGPNLEKLQSLQSQADATLERAKEIMVSPRMLAGIVDQGDTNEMQRSLDELLYSMDMLINQTGEAVALLEDLNPAHTK